MQSLAEMQAGVRRATERNATAAGNADALHLDDARRAMARAAAVASREGWNEGTQRVLERLAYDVANSASAAMTRLGRSHAASELAAMVPSLGPIAASASLTPVDAIAIEDLARGLIERIGPGIETAEAPGQALAAQASQLERIVQTEGFRAYNNERLAVERALLRANPKGIATSAAGIPARRDANWVPAIVVSWDATLDRRTCPQCAGMDRKLRLLGMAFEGGPTPPLHPRCRCFIGFWPLAFPTSQ